MINLLLACAFFLLIHFGVSGTRLRNALVARLGEGPYRAMFSLASLLLARGGTAVIDAKLRRCVGERWQAFAASTSNVPFAAIASGRNRLGPALREIGLVRPAIAIAVYVLIFTLHGRLIGVPLT